jgi:hypothetical protein
VTIELELEGHGIGKLLAPLAHSLLFEATSGCDFSDNKILGSSSRIGLNMRLNRRFRKQIDE